MSIKWKIGQALSRLGVVFFGLCCLGFAPFLGILSVIGAGFLINDLFLIPLAVIFLGISLWGLRKSGSVHGNWMPLSLGIIFSLLTLVFIFLVPAIAYVSIIGLISIYVWDFYLIFKAEKSQTS